ncbi:hypothetical protein MIB92_17835, partial [Aestuariirhabdus sp. Z084]|nr:hypothetical protein [Aestuariirhabdus haliotis]MCL6421462.1 hypothetical protein [Aestuariirhabdus haliotis]
MIISEENNSTGEDLAFSALRQTLVKMIEVLPDLYNSSAINDAVDVVIHKASQIEAVEELKNKRLLGIGDYEYRQAIGKSFDSLSKELQSAADKSLNIIDSRDAIKSFLNILGGAAKQGNRLYTWGATAIDIDKAIDSNDPHEVGRLTGSLVSGFFAGIFAGKIAGALASSSAASVLGLGFSAVAVGSLGAVVGAVAGSYFVGTVVNDYLAEEFPDAYEDLGKGIAYIWEGAEELGKSAINGVSSFLGWDLPFQEVDAVTASTYNSAQEYTPPPPVRRDPLALDLDGDGIETTPADGTVLFDHTADGVKQATGWLAPDDGFLVLDRNGNGTIDDGTELFGDSTPLADGTNAVDGFEALAELDENGDGKVDSEDSGFTDLRLWQDLNSDGVSQENELLTMEQLGIQSLNTANTPDGSDIGGGNVLLASGTYTRIDGSTGTTGTTGSVEEADLGDLDLASNPFFREFTDPLEVPESMQNLPDMKGSGAVRDLLQAATLSPTMAALLSQYANASGKGEQESILDNLIVAWSKTAEFDTLGERLDSWNATNPDNQRTYIGEYSEGNISSLMDKLQVLEVFNGQSFQDVQNIIRADGSSALFGAQNQMIDRAYESLKSSIYNALLVQTRLQSYTEAVSLSVEGGEFTFDFSAMEDVFITTLEGNNEAVYDLFELAEIVNKGDAQSWNLKEFITSNLDSLPALQALGSSTYNNSQYIIGSNLDDVLSGDAQSNLILGGTGDDTIHAGNHNDTVLGGEGNDTIVTTYIGSNNLSGGAGDDLIQVDRSANVYRTYNAETASKYSNV